MPLNQKLYNLLRQRLGEVSIVNEGQPFVGVLRTDPLSGHLEMIPRQRGEQYRVNCPFCDDTRRRLYFSHRWGVWDEQIKSANHHLVRCFNEECISQNIGARDTLVEQILGHRNRDHKEQFVISHSDEPIDYNIRPEMPGVVTKLADLPFSHHANAYIRTRGFDPVQLSERYAIGYCTEAKGKYSLAENRLIIPIYMDGIFKGWQGRYIGDKDWKTCRIPKYNFMSGMQKANLLYNYDRARTANRVIIVEGAPDAWSVGGQAVALFGKSASHQQIKLICANWKKAVVLLDPDAEDESIALTERLCEAGVVATRVSLPSGCDAGSLDQKYLWTVINASK